MTEDSQPPATATTLWDRHEALFLDRMADCLDRHDVTEYAGHRQAAGTRVFSRSRVYRGEKLDRVMVNQYSLKPGRGGLVIFGYPRVEYPIPSFLLHIGGMPPDRTLLILDLAPSLPDMEMTPFGRVAESQRTALGLPDGGVDWLRAVTSPHLLYCALQPLDPERFLDTLAATLEVWRSDYIQPAERDGNEASIRARRDQILTMKQVIFRNDPAFPVFTRHFGRGMSDVFAEAAFGGDPAVAIAETAETLPTPGSWVNKKLGVGWTAEAQEQVHEAPLFIRPMIRHMIEKEAAKEGISLVTPELVLQCERKYRGGSDH